VEPSAPTVEPPAEEAQPRDFCPTCGTAYEPLQEYCLECGERLPVNNGLVGVLATGWQRRLRWYPGDWVWPALAFLALAAIAAFVAVVLGGSGSGGQKTVVATGNSVTLGPGAATGTVSTSSAPLPTAPEPTVPGRPKPRPTPRPRPGSTALATWPAGKSGYTVVLESIPTSSGRALAIQRAHRAKAAGLPQVGVLESSAYSTFHPGYYVVFSGIYGSSSEAASGVSSVHSHGFADAYQKQVTK
jgi:hypothetical protein